MGRKTWQYFAKNIIYFFNKTWI